MMRIWEAWPICWQRLRKARSPTDFHVLFECRNHPVWRQMQGKEASPSLLGWQTSLFHFSHWIWTESHPPPHVVQFLQGSLTIWETRQLGLPIQKPIDPPLSLFYPFNDFRKLWKMEPLMSPTILTSYFLYWKMQLFQLYLSPYIFKDRKEGMKSSSCQKEELLWLLITVICKKSTISKSVLILNVVDGKVNIICLDWTFHKLFWYTKWPIQYFPWENFEPSTTAACA